MALALATMLRTLVFLNSIWKYLTVMNVDGATFITAKHLTGSIPSVGIYFTWCAGGEFDLQKMAPEYKPEIRSMISQPRSPLRTGFGLLVFFVQRLIALQIIRFFGNNFDHASTLMSFRNKYLSKLNLVYFYTSNLVFLGFTINIFFFYIIYY